MLINLLYYLVKDAFRLIYWLLEEFYPNQTNDFVIKIKKFVSDKIMYKYIDCFDDSIIQYKIKELLKKYL